MIRRALLAVLLWPLLATTVLGQESMEQGESGFHLKGILISPTSRSALLNNKVAREGDHVGGAYVLAIEEGSVRLLVRSQELTVNVGGTAVPDFSAPRPSRTVRRVVKGDTLSGIAQHYLSGGITIDQMMIALFQANPDAFAGNINVLHEGAELRIPEARDVLRHAAETATAKVQRQTDDWLHRHHQETQMLRVSVQPGLVPVKAGDTLSAIAKRIAPDGTTINQTMIALYQANPQAFSGNINILHAGAVLRIPDAHEVSRQAPESALAEVLRQTDAWRAGDSSPYTA